MSLANEEKEIKTLKSIVILYIFIFAIKLAVYLKSGVLSLFAESLHTLCDLFISIFLLLALIWSRKGADEGHMYGHGRSQNVAALVAATMFISFTSYKLYEESIPKLFMHEVHEYKNLSLVIIVLVVSIIIAGAPLLSLIKQKKRGAAAKAQMLELVNDELGLIAALLGTLFIIWGYPIADPIASIAVATIIAINAIGLFRENLSFLIGKSPGKEFLDKISNLAMGVAGVINIHNIKAEYVGPDEVHADMHILVERGIPVEDADLIMRKVREKIQSSVNVKYCSIHLDATAPVEKSNHLSGENKPIA